MKTKWRREEAEIIAKDILNQLQRVTAKIAVVGSIIRSVKDVDRIEIEFVPETVIRRIGVFGLTTIDLADEQINCLVRNGFLCKKNNASGSPEHWGPIGKQAVHKTTGIPVFLRAKTLAEWSE